VNARNGFGGMTGFVPFIVTVDDRVTIDENDTPTFKTEWQRLCES
jgi:hypothetical protein